MAGAKLSWSKVKPYFRNACEDLGLEESLDPYDPNTVPSTILNKSFQLKFNGFSTLGMNNQTIDTEVSVLLRIFRTDLENATIAEEQCAEMAELIIKDVLKSSKRLQDEIKNVIFERLDINLLNEANDRVVVGEMSFRVRVLICFED